MDSTKTQFGREERRGGGRYKVEEFENGMHEEDKNNGKLGNNGKLKEGRKEGVICNGKK